MQERQAVRADPCWRHGSRFERRANLDRAEARDLGGQLNRPSPFNAQPVQPALSVSQDMRVLSHELSAQRMTHDADHDCGERRSLEHAFASRTVAGGSALFARHLRAVSWTPGRCGVDVSSDSNTITSLPSEVAPIVGRRHECLWLRRCAVIWRTAYLN